MLGDLEVFFTGLRVMKNIRMGAGAVARMIGQNRFRYLVSGCRIYLSPSVTIGHNSGSGAGTAVSWLAEDFDTDTMHDVSSDQTKVTVKMTGKYHVTISGRWQANGTGERVLQVRKNGTATDLIVAHAFGNAGAPRRQTASGTLALDAADYLEVYALQTSGGNLNLESSGQETSFEVIYVGE